MPASYTNSYKYRIYNTHERSSSSSATMSSSSKLGEAGGGGGKDMIGNGSVVNSVPFNTMSMDRRNLNMYRSFSRPKKSYEQRHLVHKERQLQSDTEEGKNGGTGKSLFYRSLVRFKFIDILRSKRFGPRGVLEG